MCWPWLEVSLVVLKFRTSVYQKCLYSLTANNKTFMTALLSPSILHLKPGICCFAWSLSWFPYVIHPHETPQLASPYLGENQCLKCSNFLSHCEIKTNCRSDKNSFFFPLKSNTGNGNISSLKNIRKRNPSVSVIHQKKRSKMKYGGNVYLCLSSLSPPTLL